MVGLSNFFDFIPPLRIIITNKCNGHCYFCHNEGNYSNLDMPISTIKECAIIASKLNIDTICITGGEPSVREDLSDIINVVSENYNGKIILTSNGYKLANTIGSIKGKIYKLNLSITSLKKDTNLKFQNVDPDNIITIIRSFPAIQINLNVVLSDYNCDELNDIVNFCESNNISLDIMSVLNSDPMDEKKFIKEIRKIKCNINPYLELSNTPKLVIRKMGNAVVSVKHPCISSIILNKICQTCQESCFEYLCAVRVYPDKKVSPCLNNKFQFSSDLLRDNIKNAYKLNDNNDWIL